MFGQVLFWKPAVEILQYPDVVVIGGQKFCLVGFWFFCLAYILRVWSMASFRTHSVAFARKQRKQRI